MLNIQRVGFVLFIILLAVNISIADLNDGLVAYWPFDGDASDASGNGNDGVVNGPTLIPDWGGCPDSAYRFDGIDDYINIGNNVKPTFPLSISLWLKVDSFEMNASVFRNDHVNHGGNRYGLDIHIWSDGKIYTHLYEGFSTASNRRSYYPDYPLLEDNNWHHVCVVYNNLNSIIIYFDGYENNAPFLSGSGSGMTYGGYDGAIGHHISNQTWSRDYFHGSIDEVRVYNRALSPEEVESFLELPPCTEKRELIYVDDDALNDPGPNDLSISDQMEDGSVEHPFDMIQEGIDAAQDGDTVVVLSGTYWETIDFKGKKIEVTGFEPGVTDEEILPYPIINGNGHGPVVTFTQGEDPNTVLSGFTITGGNADSNDPDHAGGGLFIDGGSPTISRCAFRDNQASWSGGAVFCQSSGAILRECTFIGNTAAHGGAMYFLAAQDAKVENCLFVGNECIYEGGALALDTGSAEVTGCIFRENVASWSGGAVFIHPAEEKFYTFNQCEFTANTSLGLDLNTGGGAVFDRGNGTLLRHCLFQGNRSLGDPGEQSGLGGAVYCDGASTNLINCTFAGNVAHAGNAIACNVYETPGDALITNSILWDEGDEIWVEASSSLAVSYSNIYSFGIPLYLGNGNINVDPYFTMPGYWADPIDPDLMPGEPRDPNTIWIEGDYHLMSYKGRWDPIVLEWVQDEYQSPSIDAGDPASDLSNEPEPNGGRINLGAYGGTPQASMSLELFSLFISSGNGGIASPGIGIFEYDHGTVANVEALTLPNYHFVNWTGTAVNAGKVADPNSASTTVTMDADYTLRANFELNPRTLTISSTAGGTVSTPGIGSFEYKYGTDANVEAIPETNYQFTNWTGTEVDAGKVANPSSDSTTVTMDADYTLVANFTSIDVILTTSSTTGGTVTTPGIGSYDYKYGNIANVEATTQLDYHFVNWTGTAVDAGKVDDPNSAGTTVTMDADYTLRANFELIPKTLTISSSAGGTVSTPGIGIFEYDRGTIVDIEATSQPNYQFANWSGTAVDAGKVADPNSAGTTVTMDADYTLIAYFEAIWLISSDVPKEILDFETVHSSLYLDGLSGMISDVDVQIDITHTFNADMDVYLISPNGIRVELFTDIAIDGRGFDNTVIDDEATMSIVDGSAPFIGSYRPEGLLSTLDGQNPNGNWQLEIIDHATGDTGSLNNWALIIRTTPVP